MKLRIVLSTGWVFRCEGIIRTHADGKLITITKTENEDFPVIFCAPTHQVIYCASDEVASEATK